MSKGLTDVIHQVWHAAGFGDLPDIAVAASGPRTVYDSTFDVTGLAVGAVAAAAVAAADLVAVRRGDAVPAVAVSSGDACAAFRAEALFAPDGWSIPPLWDPVAGNYATSDGWIRLHTNYAHHRAAVAQVLGTAEDRESVEAAVASWSGEKLESAVVEAGGAAAVLRSRAQWLASPQGQAVGGSGVEVHRRPAHAAPRWARRGGSGPFAGVRVLDLTRVIAGPMCTKFLAAYGADVLRIDPPGFAEVPGLLPETTVGKRSAALDLKSARDRAVFERLVSEADVLVCGLRADAMDRLGLGADLLTGLNPDLIVATVDAYGWTGPWRERRGFDSLVQLSCGIADDAAREAGLDHPGALTVQALDHATGWLLAAAVAQALAAHVRDGEVLSIRSSLVATANLLYGLGRVDSPVEAMPSPTMEATPTSWGPARRVAVAGSIEGIAPSWAHPAGPLGGAEPRWEAM